MTGTLGTHLQRDVGPRPVLQVSELQVSVPIHEVDTEQLLTLGAAEAREALAHGPAALVHTVGPVLALGPLTGAPGVGRGLTELPTVALSTEAGVAVYFVYTLGPVLAAVISAVILVLTAVVTCITWCTLTPGPIRGAYTLGFVLTRVQIQGAEVHQLLTGPSRVLQGTLASVVAHAIHTDASIGTRVLHTVICVHPTGWSFKASRTGAHEARILALLCVAGPAVFAGATGTAVQGHLTVSALIAAAAGTPVRSKGVVVAAALVLARAGQAGVTLGLHSQSRGT